MKLLKFFSALLLTLAILIQSNLVHASDDFLLSVNPNISTWLWDTHQIVTNPDNLINFLVSNKVNTVYLQVDYNLDISYYKDFISKASNMNIRVQALDGAPQWTDNDGVKFQKRFFNWLTDYQNKVSANEKFTGVHLDVEPYGSTEYETNTNAILENYQEFLVRSKNRCNNLNLDFGIDIPFWFYGVQYNTKFGKGNMAEWIFKRIKSVTIMAYRDVANGENGIINISKTEMNLCEKYSVKATIAVETGSLPDTKFVTFYEEGLDYMNRELNIVQEYYKNSSSFNGIAIHYLENWMNMSK